MHIRATGITMPLLVIKTQKSLYKIQLEKRMKQVLYVILFLSFAAPVEAQTKPSSSTDTKSIKQVNVSVDKEVELMLTVVNLTSMMKNDWIQGMKKNNPATDRLIKPLMQPFNKYQSHPAVIKLDSILNSYMLSITDLPGIALNIPSFPYDVKQYKPGDRSTPVRKTREFLVLLNDFYKLSNFDKQFKKNEPIYQAIENEVKGKLPDQRVVSEMEKYYGKSFPSYNLTPSPLLPNGVGMGFGVSRKDNEGTHIHNIFSTFASADIDTIKILKPNVFFGFGQEGPLRELVVHEFGHSFVNPTIYDNEKYMPAIDSLSSLFTDELLAGMSWQGYQTWRVCLAEHCVRTGEVRIAERLGLKEDAERLMKYHTIDRKFIYLPLLLEVYKKCESDPDVRSFDDFAPAIIKALSPATKK